MTLPFVSFSDQGMYLAHKAGGQQAVIQLLWRYRRPLDLKALERFRSHLAQGSLARLVTPARLPFGRHHWRIPLQSAACMPLTLSSPLAAEAWQAWADAQVQLSMDPASGPAWNLTAQPFSDGSTLVSLVVSHCIADGTAMVLAVSAAARGESGVAPSTSFSALHPAMVLGHELIQSLYDVPATFKALAVLAQTGLKNRTTAPKSAPSDTTSTGVETIIVFPSVFVRIPVSVWDDRAKCLAANRFTLVAAMTAAFSELLGRTQNDEVTLLIPVGQRGGLSDTDANRVTIATCQVPAVQYKGRLHVLQRKLQTALLKSRRNPDPLLAMMPLLPYVPERAFTQLASMAMGALANLPVTCSHMGELPAEIFRIDGAEADHFCFRGVDRQTTVNAIEKRHGVATLLTGVASGYILLNFVAYQPGTVVNTAQLQALVIKLLERHHLIGEFFDA